MSVRTQASRSLYDLRHSFVEETLVGRCQKAWFNEQVRLPSHPSALTLSTYAEHATNMITKVITDPAFFAVIP